MPAACCARFGHADFVGPQAGIVEHVLGGGSALVLLPTGGGKSLCYQLPALLLDGVTVVLSPLIALMQDQVDQARRRGIPATFINSSLDRAERERRLAEVVAGRVKLLYVTPERFRKEPFAAAMRSLRVPLLAVDEAHCISAWGHDFRPEYARVRRIRTLLGDPPTLALTATATPDTQQDIRDKLGLEDAVLFHAGIERPNLFVGVRPVEDADHKVDRIVEVVERVDGPVIVYLALIRDLEDLRERLARRGVNALVYHGDLGAAERRRAQRDFMRSQDGVVLATNAFGMGVDKADIRAIVHAQVPGSVEALYQEVGRAGRDGQPSFCELLYLAEDLSIQQRFVEWTNPDAAFLRSVYNQLERWGDSLHARDAQDLRETLLVKNRTDGRVEVALALLRAEGIVDGTFERRDLRLARPLERGEEQRLVHPEKRARDLRRLAEVMEYARGGACRKATLHAYFGLPWPGGPCGACDVCTDPAAALAALPGPRRVEVPGTPGSQAVDSPVREGEWIVVNDRFTVRVQSIHLQGGQWIARAVSADDLRLRSYNLSRVEWRRA